MEVKKERFLALDIFRGLTICFMIIVNTSGNGDTTFAPLQHAEWIGFTPTDLVFPSFMFAVGNAMSFATKKWNTMSNTEVLGKIFKRSILMFLLGYLMYWFPFFKIEQGHIAPFPFHVTRIFGVLQRIAIAYCIASILVYYFSAKQVAIISGAILLIYWPILYLGGDKDSYLTIYGNAVVKLDRILIGESHLYHRKGIPFDPEGFLSTIPSIVNITAGFYVGQYLQKAQKNGMLLFKLALIGFLCIATAFMWNYGFPIFKKLWTSSFVLLTIGLDILFLLLIIYVVDIQQKRGKWIEISLVFGKNPLVIYLFSELLATLLFIIPIPNGQSIYQWLFYNIFIYCTPYWGAFVQAILYMLLCWLFGYILDKKRIYIKL